MDYSTPVLGRSLTPGGNRPSCCGASRPWRASCGDRSYRSCGCCWRNCPTTFLHLSRLPAHLGALVPRSGCVLAPLPSARLSCLAPTGLRTPAPRIGTGSRRLIRSTPRTSLPRTRPERHRSDTASRRRSRTRGGIGSAHSCRSTLARTLRSHCAWSFQYLEQWDQWRVTNLHDPHTHRKKREGLYSVVIQPADGRPVRLLEVPRDPDDSLAPGRRRDR